MAKIFFKLFLIDLDQKMTLAGYKRQKMTLCNSNIIYSKTWYLRRKTKTQLTVDNFSRSSQQRVTNYFLYTCKYPDFHLGKILSKFCPNSD